MTDTSNTGKVHYLTYRTLAGQSAVLFCSGGRRTMPGEGTRVLDEVTCRICRRKLVQVAMSSPGAEFGIA